MDNASAPASYSFSVDLPAGFELAPTDDGSVAVAKVTPQATYVVGQFDKPWAKDANGKALQTAFRVSGSTLTQVVSTAGARFPVTADPHYTWGWVTGTAYFNRAETRSAKTTSTAWGIAAGLCAAFGPETLFAACAISGAAAAQWSYVAGNAYGDGKCLAIVVPIMVAHAYSGNWCK